jgi:molybdopterin-containing oxidoreductase family iron-sulfur binding subunit
MPRWGMVIDLDRCTGCAACVTACKAENNIPFVGPDESARGHTINWMDMIPAEEHERGGENPPLMPRPCFHCDDPPCTKVCPVYATYSTPEGIVAQNFTRCIGCRFCMAACPYGVKFFNWYDYRQNTTLTLRKNPDVSTRPAGVVEKCTFCHHRLQLARESARREKRPFRAQDYVPACVETCPPEAIVFGDLDDPNSKVSRLQRSPRVRALLPELGTKPKVVYLAREERNEID